MSRFTLMLEPVGGGGWAAPAEVRLRRALKCLLRSFGLRCRLYGRRFFAQPARRRSRER